MTVFAMTEHMPRGDEDLYPEELEANDSAQTLSKRFDDYIAEASRLRDAYYATGSLPADSESNNSTTSTTPSTKQQQQPKAEILIALETEFIRPTTLTLLNALLTKHSSQLDFLLGSIHHVHTIPIDFDHATYLSARAACTPPTDTQLFADYFDAQHAMLHALQPHIVGHFDLIRLLSDAPDADWRTLATSDGEKLWTKIQRNLDFVKSYGGLLEINTSGWRKGLEDPYPRREIVECWRGMGGDVVLSDDSHGVAHVGTNYERLKGFLEACGVLRVAFLRRRKRGGEGGGVSVGGKGERCEIGYVDVSELR